MHANNDEGSGGYTGCPTVPGEAGGGEPDDGKLSSPVRGEVRGVPAMDASAPALLQGGGQAGGQLGLGLVGLGSPGLILGHCLGPLISLLYFVHALPTAERRQL